MLGFKLHRSKPWPINASKYFVYTLFSCAPSSGH
jgi:hypothetical protein